MMNWVLETLITGVTAFAATNVDDIVILTLFFAKVNETLRRRHVITGQYLGFLGLIAASLPGFLGGMLIPKVWVGWLGLLPIAIGIHHLLHREADETTLQTPSAVQDKGGDSTGQMTPRAISRSRLASILSPPTYQVAAVTLANGGDNVGIYVPLFAHSTLAELTIILSAFLVMIGIWCIIAYQLAQHPLLSHVLTRYGHRLVPFILIGLGIFIFMDSGTHQLLIKQV